MRLRPVHLTNEERSVAIMSPGVVEPELFSIRERGTEMRFVKLAGVAALVGILGACSSPQERAAEAQEDAYKAQENVAKKRLQLVDQYQSCVKDAAGNQQKAAACDSYLKAAEALK